MKVVLLVATSAAALPAGVTEGKFRFNIGSLPPVETTEPTATFDDVPPGTYTATVQNTDSTGAALGSPVSTEFTVPEPAPSTFRQPVSMTVTLG